MAERITQHTHCHVCGKAIPISETLCSDECKQKYQKLLRRRKFYVYFMYLLIVVIFFAYLFLSF